MKYLIWRHENALGNSAEQTVGLAKHLQKNNIKNATVFVENEFQAHFAACIPGVSKIEMLPKDGDYTTLESLLKYIPQDMHIPSVYWNDKMPFNKYPGSWAELVGPPHKPLEFPFHSYGNQHKFPNNTIVLQFRERGTHWKRVDGAESEPNRFVNPKTFFELAIYYANRGHTVVRIGDKNQIPMPKHDNIIDFAKYENRNMLDDLFLIATSKVFLSSDSGVWPMAGGMGKNLVLSNVAQAFYTDWLPKETTTVLFKKDGNDNSFEELITAVDKYL